MSLHELTLSFPNDTAGSAPPFTRVPRRQRLEKFLFDPSHRYLKLPLQITIERTQRGHWLVTCPGISTHGVGTTPEAAVRDFQSMLDDLFRELTESETVLAPHLRSELEYLRAVLVEPRLR